MTYQFTGKIVKVGNVIPTNGKVKEKCTFIVRDDDDDGREIAFLLFDDKINLYLEPLEVGDKVEVTFTIKSREFMHKGESTGDYSTNCFALSVKKLQGKKTGKDRYRQREEQEQRDQTWNSWGRNQNRQNQGRNAYSEPPPWQGSGVDYFAGCKNAEEAKKRYRKLSLENHPDRPGGSTEKMQDINKQYDRWK